MKLSSQTIVVNDFPSKGEHLLYNIRTQALVKVDQRLKEAIMSLGQGKHSLKKEECSQEIQTLFGLGILVENQIEEEKKINNFFRQMKNDVVRDVFAVTVLTTYACNFKCTYCFQQKTRTGAPMSFSLAEEVVAWIKKKTQEASYKVLYLVFYGGEPLLNKPVLEKIVILLKDWCAQQGLRFKFMLQTNGYLLTPDMVDQYIKIGLDQVRISLDGWGARHDQYRPLVSGAGTFHRILKNISDCVDKVTIGISTLYDKGDISHIEEMLDRLEEQGLLSKLGPFLFAPVHAALGPEDHPERIYQQECQCNFEDERLLNTNARLYALMRQKNLPFKNGLALAACPLTRQHSGVTIDQEGRIYKCNDMLGHPEFSVGHVKDGVDQRMFDQFLNLDVWRKCPMDCPYLPMCGGGCRFASFLEHKDFETPVCHKTYLDKMVPELVKREYLSSIDNKTLVGGL